MYIVSATDNGLHFFSGRSDVRRCVACGELADKWNDDLEGVKIEKSIRSDASYSYDGLFVGSERFKSAIEKNQIEGVVFRRLSRDLWAVSARRVVKFDHVRRETEFEDKCDLCGEYKAVTGARPAYLLPGNEVRAREFVRTDLEFASGDGK